MRRLPFLTGRSNFREASSGPQAPVSAANLFEAFDFAWEQGHFTETVDAEAHVRANNPRTRSRVEEDNIRDETRKLHEISVFVSYLLYVLSRIRYAIG